MTAVRDLLSALPAGYSTLFDRLLAAVEPDERIRGCWLSGSVARGVADAGSDLDVVVAVRDEDFGAFAAGWREWLATITPTVIARELPGRSGSFYSVTARCERFDVVALPVSQLLDSTQPALVTVMDRDALTARVTIAQPSRGPDPVRMLEIVEEFYRQQAIFPAAVVARQDWLLGVVGVVNTQTMLYQLLVEANQPLPMMGIKQWSARLTSDQRQALEALPVPEPNRDSVIAAMLATRETFRTLGRRTVSGLGVAWPDTLDQAVDAYYAKELSSWSAARTTANDTSAE